jgi:hypothetical protein
VELLRRPLVAAGLMGTVLFNELAADVRTSFALRSLREIAFFPLALSE